MRGRSSRAHSAMSADFPVPGEPVRSTGVLRDTSRARRCSFGFVRGVWMNGMADADGAAVAAADDDDAASGGGDWWVGFGKITP